MMKPKYRISRDSVYSGDRWAVQSRRWWWPFWVEEIGLLGSRKEAAEMIEILSSGATK